MDTVTHALAGSLSAQAGFRQRMGRVATGALTVSAAAPDIDGLMRFQDTAFYLSVHRGITHSVVGIVLAYRWPFHSIRVGRTALVLLGGYMPVAAAAHQSALIRLRGRVERENLPATRLAALPIPFGPLRWSGVVATDE